MTTTAVSGRLVRTARSTRNPSSGLPSGGRHRSSRTRSGGSLSIAWSASGRLPAIRTVWPSRSAKATCAARCLSSSTIRIDGPSGTGSLLFHGKDEPHAGPPSLRTRDADRAVVHRGHLSNRVETETEPFLLGAGERPEDAVAQEVLGHPRSLVLDRHGDLPAAASSGELRRGGKCSLPQHRLDRVLDGARERGAKKEGVSPDRGKRVVAFPQDDPAREIRAPIQDRVLEGSVDVDPELDDEAPFMLPQVARQPSKVHDRVVEELQRRPLEEGILEVLRQVLGEEREAAREVLEIVDRETHARPTRRRGAMSVPARRAWHQRGASATETGAPEANGTPAVTMTRSAGERSPRTRTVPASLPRIRTVLGFACPSSTTRTVASSPRPDGAESASSGSRRGVERAP